LVTVSVGVLDRDVVPLEHRQKQQVAEMRKKPRLRR
jgi:hypothetical protein